MEIKKCPFCVNAWLYVSDGDYYSDYESNGYRVNCKCGYAWKAIFWQKTREQAIEAWNRIVDDGREENYRNCKNSL